MQNCVALQSNVPSTRPLIIREKGLGAGAVGRERMDAAVSATLMFVVSGAVMAVAAWTLWAKGGTIVSVLDMAETLQPLMGRFAVALFMCGTLAAGLFGYSLIGGF